MVNYVVKVTPTVSRYLVDYETGTRRYQEWTNGKWVSRDIDNVTPISSPLYDMLCGKEID